MKTLKLFSILILCFGLLVGTSSCLVITKKDNGKHNGWFKNPKNPHHHNSTNPVKSKGNHKK